MIMKSFFEKLKTQTILKTKKRFKITPKRKITPKGVKLRQKV